MSYKALKSLIRKHVNFFLRTYLGYPLFPMILSYYVYTNVISGNCMYVLLGDPDYDPPGLRGERGKKVIIVLK